MAKRKRTSGHVAGTRVVGIGASAGGIAALRSFFRALAARPNLCLVVLQHLKPGEPSRLRGMIGRWTDLLVLDPVDGERPRTNRVYVASPDVVLTLEGGAFRTAPLDLGTHRPGIDTIDTFFESLARDRGPRAMAVVLSGSGSDGAGGAICIKRAGGVVLTQDAVTATHESMPQAVIAAGAADYVLPPEAIAEQLIRCAARGYVRPKTPVRTTAAITQTLDGIIGLIRRQAGFDLSGYKLAPLVWRVQHRMARRRVESFQGYESLLQDDPAELEALVRGIPIHVTEFFRDAEAWRVLSQDVIEPLVHRGKPIRVWTPACATGEEAYSVAMLLAEHAETAGRVLDFQVFATDADPDVLARAGRGIFLDKAVQRIPAERRARFMYAVDGGWRVKRSLRERMVFAAQDLLSDPAFSDLDLVTCRNLLIYLDADAIVRVTQLLHSSLRVGGHLFLGRSEQLSPRESGFEPISPRFRIYRKVGPTSGVKVKLSSRPVKRRHAMAVPASAHRAALEHFDLPSVLIDEDFNVLRVYGDTEQHLRLPAGPPTHRLTELLPPVLGPAVKHAFQQALAERRSVTVTGIRDRRRKDLSSSLRLTPLQTAGDGGSPRVLVSFLSALGRDGRGTDREELLAEVPDPVTDAPELSEVIRVSHEELEASREELQALNEELNTANEQLNLANEDLNAANAQLTDKIAALQMQSRVLSSGGVMTLFLDQDLKVHWFTPGVKDLIPLMPGDAGRRITDLTRFFDDDDFIDDVRAVLELRLSRDAEVRSPDGRWFMRRIRPYLPGDTATTGVAITFADITALKDAEAELRRNQASLAGQNQAFQEAMNGAPLEKSLAVLVCAAIEQMGDDVCCAFYLADAAGRELHHLIGMPEAHGEGVDGFQIGPDSPASGLAAFTGRAVITPDVLAEPLWQPWLKRARDFAYRACWSFPVQTTSKVVGTLAIYHRQPRQASERDLEVAAVLTRAAAIIISRHQVAEERLRAEEALRQSEESLAADLRDTTLLRDLAERLVTEDNLEKIYDEILSVAMALMHAQAGTVQIYERETKSLVLLVTRYFDRRMTDHFHRVDAGSRTACGIALRTGQRTFIDFDTDVTDEAGLMHVEAGYRSAQATPLVSRKGAPLGMLNTHWHASRHRPSERELRFLDLLARQAADLIEQKALRESQQQLKAVLDSSAEGIEVVDAAWRVVYRNAAGRRLLQPRCDPGDGVGQRLWDAHPMLVGTPFEAAVRRAMERREPAYLTLPIARTERKLEAHICPLAAGGVSVHYQDVTERQG